MANNYRERVCRECASHFSGGPRAWYCPKCRKIRRQKASRESKERKKLGETRQIGSTDYCVVCSGPYIVDGANQKYCKNCAPMEIAKAARKLSIDHYKRNKDQIVPARKLRRRKTIRVCKLCKKEFEKYGSGYFCESCIPEAKRLRQARGDAKRYNKAIPLVPPPKRKISDWSTIDFNKPIKQLVSETGCRYETIWAARKRLNEKNAK